MLLVLTIVLTLKQSSPSITSKDISSAIKDQYDIDIDKKDVDLGEEIKAFGEYLVKLKIYAGVSCNIKLRVEEDN